MVIAAQTRAEAEWLVGKMRDYQFGNSILEIGSHAGGMLEFMAYNCKPGAKIRSIERSRLHGIEDAIKRLQVAGYDAEWLQEDSKSPDAIYWAAKNGPYDFVFIDGGHNYQDVDADWKNYGLMGRWVGFHDIMEPGLGSIVHWNEIKGKYPSMEFSILPDWNGIGVVHMPQYGETYLHAHAANVKFHNET